MYDARDIYYMRIALEEARMALQCGDVPVGAVVVTAQGDHYTSGHNRTEIVHSQAEHAEVAAMRSMGQYLCNWRLTGATLYVTLEPCMMCISLAALSRVERVVYGAASPHFGHSLDTEGILSLYTNRIKCIVAGVLANESALLLQECFVRSREVDRDF
jgi:tRNA(adenine34) deaminase